ncbi:hypothetical protein [Ilumatobacter sp.]|uniref:hypothetical protein n=1 Tax=Ilumatobacter sp. TaxID=1967498 RepID=UPI003C536F1E
MSNKPTTVAVATYATKAAADSDYEAIRSVKSGGQLDHLAVAVVTKGKDGKLDIDRHDSTAKHLAWGGGILGAAATVVFAPLGLVFLGPLVTNTAVYAGAGGLVGHFWHNIPKDDVHKMGELLASGEYGVIVVAVNPAGTDVGALLANAQSTQVVDGVYDTEGALDDAFVAADN